MHKFIILFLGLICFTFIQQVTGQQTSLSADTNIKVIDGNVSPYNQLHPGDTIFLEPGHRKYLLIRNFTGTQQAPFVFSNKSGVVTISTDHYFGIIFNNCRHFKLTGSGDPQHFYGIRIEKVENGSGLSIGAGSSDAEVEYVYVANTHIAGIYAKTDPDCAFQYTRDQFTQYNTSIHDCSFYNTGCEGMYVGSTKYFGQTVKCNGKDTLLFPSILDGVTIYNNILMYTKWDGIQVSSASKHCAIHDNIILYDSQEESFNQMSGILIGGGSKCDCYNNYIGMGKGIGIESHGLGGYRIFNNIILNAGYGYLPLDSTKMKHGIFINDYSVEQDSSFSILFNTIINPKSDGIRYHSHKSSNDLIASNVIINPGNFDFYEHGNSSKKGIDSYVMVLDTPAPVNITHNFMSRTMDSAKFSDALFQLKEISPLINNAFADTRGINIDYDYHMRPGGTAGDIGAFEYQFPDTASIGPGQLNALLYNNPVRENFNLRVTLADSCNLVMDIFSIKGNHVLAYSYPLLPAGENTLNASVAFLKSGLYLFTLRNKNILLSGKFVKL